jgi:intein/homing endonuclease
MKHEVEKEMFKITVNGKSVIVTEDHSVMIFRDGKLRSCKAKDIKSEDKLISKK